MIRKLENFTKKKEMHGDLAKKGLALSILGSYIKAVEQYAKINIDLNPSRNTMKKLKEQQDKME